MPSHYGRNWFDNSDMFGLSSGTTLGGNTGGGIAPQGGMIGTGDLSDKWKAIGLSDEEIEWMTKSGSPFFEEIKKKMRDQSAEMGEEQLGIDELRAKQQELIEVQLEYAKWQWRQQLETIDRLKDIEDKYKVNPKLKAKIKGMIHRSTEKMVQIRKDTMEQQQAVAGNQIARQAEARGMQRSGRTLGELGGLSSQKATALSQMRAAQPSAEQARFKNWKLDRENSLTKLAKRNRWPSV